MQGTYLSFEGYDACEIWRAEIALFGDASSGAYWPLAGFEAVRARETLWRSPQTYVPRHTAPQHSSPREPFTSSFCSFCSHSRESCCAVPPAVHAALWLVQAAALAKLAEQLTTLPVISLSFLLRSTLLLSQLCPRNSYAAASIVSSLFISLLVATPLFVYELRGILPAWRNLPVAWRFRESRNRRTAAQRNGGLISFWAPRLICILSYAVQQGRYSSCRPV